MKRFLLLFLAACSIASAAPSQREVLQQLRFLTQRQVSMIEEKTQEAEELKGRLEQAVVESGTLKSAVDAQTAQIDGLRAWGMDQELRADKAEAQAAAKEKERAEAVRKYHRVKNIIAVPAGLLLAYLAFSILSLLPIQYRFAAAGVAGIAGFSAIWFFL